MPFPFRDRTDAGRQLAVELQRFARADNLLVLALPRGGVPVAYEVAASLNAPLDVLIVRKLGTPGCPELAMGALASGGVRVLNADVVNLLRPSHFTIERITQEELKEIARRERVYRGDRPAVSVTDRTVIVVDDGVATGSTLRAALQCLRQQKPRRLIAAFPVGAAETVAELRALADEVVCLETPAPLHAISLWYRAFPQLRDQDVRALLEQAHRRTPGAA
jgi:putative phosphoribosyl transferase